MHRSAIRHSRLAPDASAASTVATLFVHACDRDTPRVSIPRSEIHLIVRFGPATPRGLDLHVLGPRRKVQRKLLPAGQKMVVARLPLGAHQAMFGTPASSIAGRIVALEDLWGAAARQLLDRLAEAPDMDHVAALLQSAIAGRPAAALDTRAELALNAAERLKSASVSAVAAGLGVSERHLRRVFREAIGVSPKEFARLERFRRALRAASGHAPSGWAGIAAGAGYYDQAHLIAEFRAIAGVTPSAFLDELGAAI